MTVEGYLGKPVLVRSNRNFETYYVNGRFIKSSVVAKAIEEGYKEYLMQHKFPFCVLHFTMDPEKVDVNVHPTKMDVRFSDNFMISEFISRTVKDALVHREMIPQDRLLSEKEIQKEDRREREEAAKVRFAEPYEKNRMQAQILREDTVYRADGPKKDTFQKSPVWERVRAVSKEPKEKERKDDGFFVSTSELPFEEEKKTSAAPLQRRETPKEFPDKQPEIKAIPELPKEKPKQLDLFEEKILTQSKKSQYRIIGQVFDTYWMFQYQEKLCILDQHAAHEKVKYERFMKRYREKEMLSQVLLPPVIVTLSGQEEVVLRECREIFEKMGFEIEDFGGNEYALRSVPVDLYGCGEREMFLSVLDELESGVTRQSPKVVEEKIASMSCKAAVKGNNRLSYEEADELIEELLTLENPYNCPHGRPTIITISKYDMEKKFKRII